MLVILGSKYWPLFDKSLLYFMNKCFLAPI